ncbi:hypothetical protein [Pyxidicoccus caerfyrddinensis]|uniref:hypothetical protein n=1 Tax=Pyxidicoccus caerfyrddinensis TaxID=2709663 RepID=UPI0013DAE092|nr:hypothetical protein [Pyxidicoccus caerfyrddinensis]
MYEAFRIARVHERTGKDLLHLDFREAPEGMALVIHPQRNAPQALELRILGDPIEVDDAIAEERFTAEQLRLYHELQMAETKPLSGPQERPAGAALTSGRIRALWSSTRLTFIRRLIEPLAPDDIFVVEVSGQATYAMSRRQFEADFPNVVASRAYSEYGSYNYKDTPQRASAYIVR